MRLLFRRVRYRGIEHDLDIIRNTLCSSSFVYIDVLFLSLILAVFSFANYQSIPISSFIFTGCYTFCICLFIVLKKWLRDQPD
ncbi:MULTISPECIES: hypothetical protein [Bacillaceae]|uniref:hypothetical protein n=1 Tax=Bacillaceae TaxID=186817 RepID=UPI000BA594C1|nr:MULTISPECIES: hypothetical protein [Bacillaceae]PAE24530.1 hypothetical protein CHI10_12385 [Bacillus sp. 7894-2]URM34390.1 hypothetical protein LLY41_08365 [Cytobacillus firmus]